MLSAVDPVTFGRNLWLIIAALLLLGAASVVAFWGIAIVRALLAARRQTRALEAYTAATRRPDGRPYPPFFEGRCQQCGRGDRRIYATEDNRELCPRCLEGDEP